MSGPRMLAIGLSGCSAFLRVAAFPRPGETITAGGLRFEPGGKAYNQAVAAARLGARMRLLSAVGRDDGARQCRERLLLEQVEPCYVEKPDSATAYAAILTDEAGENAVTVYPGASALLTARDVERAEPLFAGMDFVLLQCELPEEALATAFALAKRHGAPVLLDPAPCTPFAAAYLHQAAVVTPNRQEACGLLGLPVSASLEALAKAAGAIAAPMVITLGGEGALVCEKGGRLRLPAPKAKVLDTTGAGDAFAAALAVRLAAGDGLETAARFAVASAARSVEYPMALAGLGKPPAEGERP